MKTHTIYPFRGKLGELISHGLSGTNADIDFIMGQLLSFSSVAVTRYVDYALSLVECQEGFERIKFYLFNGTQVQRNYASLYLNRMGEWEPVKEAYEKGLIDEIQAFAR
ncbi:hypothetical protein [Maribellus sediminis]|uniref:hypothetical protein n=1 Tax=Maribellus sediminis TaxID=2696285 RepID=UPI0014304650|nr:hypothetical protein [Maribellus sediminis]